MCGASSTTARPEELLYEELAKILQATWYIMETAQHRLQDIVENAFPPNVVQRMRCLDRPPTTEKPSGGGGKRDNSEHRFSQVQYSTTVQHYHCLEDHEELERRVVQARYSWAKSRKGRLSDNEIFQEPSEITTGIHQLEGDASSVITGAVNDRLE